MINYNNVAISFVEDSAFHFFFQCHHSQNGIIRQITSYSLFYNLSYACASFRALSISKSYFVSTKDKSL